MRKIISEDSLHPYKKLDGKEFVLDTSKYIIKSRMIDNFLTTDNVKVIFSNSVNNVYNCILDNVNSSISIIVYYDLVFDNEKTIDKLINLLDKLTYNKNNSVFIVPLPCIEYQLVKAFGYDCELKEILLNFRDYKNTKIYKYNMSHKRVSHEKFCKAALGELVDKRFLGNCNITDYCISSEDEYKLVSTLPITYCNKENFGVVSATDVLEKEYTKFMDILDCNDSMKVELKHATDRYINMLRN